MAGAQLGSGQTTTSVASWADQIRTTRRQTAPWHFVDIPIGQIRFDPARDCADSGILGRLVSGEQLLPELSRESAGGRKKWAKGTVTQWPEESHKVGRKLVYDRLPHVASDELRGIDAAYEKAAMPTVRKQIERAAVRLAWALNSDLR